jgi:uncharacterized protein DUF6314
VPPSAFLGTWEVRRRLVDFRAGATSRFEGVATIRADAFEEKGRVYLGSTVLEATRKYRLRFEARLVAVCFPDGGDFIRLDDQPSQPVRHWCEPDLYRGRFFFMDADHWVEAWRVIGPRKHYASVSHYRRASGRYA